MRTYTKSTNNKDKNKQVGLQQTKKTSAQQKKQSTEWKEYLKNGKNICKPYIW